MAPSVSQLARRLLDHADDGPVVLGIGADRFDVHARPLDPARPHAELFGFDAPADWLGVAVAFPARVAATTAGVRSTTAVHLTLRTGGAATVVADRPGVLHPVEGWLTDACRRVLGLSTPPPAHSSAHLLAHRGLDRILTHLLDAAGPLDWATCRVLLVGPGAALVDDSTLARLGPAFARRHPWARLRDTPAAVADCDLSADQAAWLDDGAFARWVLGGYGELAQVRDDVARLAEPTVARRLDVVLSCWLDH